MGKIFQKDTNGTLTNGLVSYYKMEGNSTDFYGSNNGSDTSITYGTSYGKINQGASFNGSSSTISIPDTTSLQITGDVTVSLWVYSNILSTDSHFYTLLAKRNNPSYAPYAINFNNNNSGSNFQWFFGDGTSFRISSYTGATFPYQQWTLVTCTRASGIMKTYWNGVLKQTTDLSAYTPNGAVGTNLTFGEFGSSEYFSGDLDEIGVWNRALNSTEISDLYNGGAGNTMVYVATPFFNAYRGSIGRFFQGDPTLVGYWQLDGSSVDNSGNGNNGTDTAVSYSPAYSRFSGGQGASFNGSSSYISLPNLSGLSVFSVSVWFKTTSSGVIFGDANTTVGGSPNTYDPIIYVGTDGTLKGGLYNGADNPLNTSRVVNDGKWHLATVTFTGTSGTQTMYLDGAQVASASQTLAMTTYQFLGVTYTTWVSTNNSWFYFNGQIDESAIFTRALTPAEISQYYQWATSAQKKSWYGSIVQAIQSGAAFLYEFLSSN